MRRTSVLGLLCTPNIWFGKFRIRRPFIFCYCKQSKVWKRLTFWHMAWALDGKKSKAIENSNATSKFMEAPLCPITLRFMTFLAQMLYFFEGNWVLGEFAYYYDWVLTIIFITFKSVYKWVHIWSKIGCFDL